MLSEIGCTQIRDNFWYGYYGPLRVVVDKTDGFINATKLCLDGGKQFYHWKESKVSKELISTLQSFNFAHAIDDDQSREPWSVASYTPIPEVIRFVRTSHESDIDKAIIGTYCHPLLIPHIACWVSPNFAIKVSSIINFFIVEDWRAKLAASERAAAQLLSNFELQQQQQQLALESAQQSVVATQNFLDVKKENIEQLQEKVMDKARERKVWASTHAFTLLHLHDENSKRPYYVIRCQGRRMGTTITKLRRKHSAAEVIYQQRKVPNAVNLYTRLKDQRIVQCTRNYCTPNCTQQQLLFHLNSLCGTSYPASNPEPLNIWIKSEPASP
jgi:hypothetical protein